MSEPRKQLGDYVAVMTSLPDMRKSASTSSLKCLENGEATVPDVDRFEGGDDVTNGKGAGICDVTKVKLSKSDLPSFNKDYDDDDVFDNDDAKVPDLSKYDECIRTPSEASSSDSSVSASDDESDDLTFKEHDCSSSESGKSDESPESDGSESDSDLRVKVLNKLQNIRISKPKKVHFTVIVEERIEYEVRNYQHQGKCTMWVPKFTDKNKKE